jgi:FKBP-type peptidyl-prolyl cis-trans isomerase
MKKISIFILAFILFYSFESYAQNKVTLKNQQDSLSYGIGLNWGKMLKKDSIMVDLKLVNLGLSDGFNLGTGALTDDDINNIFSFITKQIDERNQRKMQELAAINLKKGADFLERNKKDPKVITTASGLQYKIISHGTGPMPSLSD